MKKVTGIACLLLVALMLLGAGYAYWSDALVLNGTVQTGTVDWRFIPHMTRWTDEVASPPYTGTTNDWTCEPGFLNVRQLDKNVGWGTWSISPDGDTLNASLHNAYPCYYNNLTVYTQNTGTVPIHFNYVVIRDGQGDIVDVLTPSHEPLVVDLDLSGPNGVPDGLPDLEFHWGDNIGSQIHPGVWKEISMDYHVLQPCPQNASLDFSLELEAGQWNEAPPSIPTP